MTQRKRGDGRRSKKCRNWARSDWTRSVVDGGQSSDGYSRVTPPTMLPGRAWPHRRRLDGWAAGMGSVHMSVSVSALMIVDRPSFIAQQGRLST